MADTNIDYGDSFGIGTFKREIVGQLGGEVWEKITDNAVIPDMGTEYQHKCANMKVFMERFDHIAGRQTAKKVLSKVRHGLQPSQSAWAREKFLEIGNLDDFIEQQKKEEIADFEKLLEEGKDFYGQPINREVIDFLKANPTLLSGIRKGNKIYITQFPAQAMDYLHAPDPRMKRFYACHCPFARDSILTEEVVSPTLCYCSLGHAINFWEAVFDTELEGEVLTSALNGDEMCRFTVTIPDKIMNA